jgi:hypothetical protein
LISTGYNFLLAFSRQIGVSLIKKTAKRKAEEFLLQPKKCVYMENETYFFFAVFFTAFFAGAFFAGIL